MKKKTVFWIVVIAVVVIDRITKELAGGIPAEGITLIPGVVGLRYAENRGAAFSMLSGQPRILGVLSLVLIVGGYIWLRRGSPFAQSMGDPDDNMIRRKLLSVNAMYLTI